MPDHGDEENEARTAKAGEDGTAPHPALRCAHVHPLLAERGEGSEDRDSDRERVVRSAAKGRVRGHAPRTAAMQSAMSDTIIGTCQTMVMKRMKPAPPRPARMALPLTRPFAALTSTLSSRSGERALKIVIQIGRGWSVAQRRAG